VAKKKKPSLGKEEALEIAIKNINDTMGLGSVIFGDTGIPDIDKFSSGSYSLDVALGGGWARGRIAEVYGPESSGKTTLALHAVAEIQKAGGFAAFIDMEHAFDASYAESIGINLKTLVFAQPNHGEQALQLARQLIETGSLDLIVVDSVAALIPKAEVEGEIGDNHVGRQSRLMSAAMRHLAPITHDNNTTIIFINQIRMKIGVMFGSPETTSGGESLKYYASQRVDIRRIEKLKEGTGKDIEFVGNVTRARVVKNKIAPPFREAQFTIQYGVGIDKFLDLIDSAVKLNIIKKSGAWFSYKGCMIGQGKAKTSLYLQENPTVYNEIKQILEGSYQEPEETEHGLNPEPNVSSIEASV